MVEPFGVEYAERICDLTASVREAFDMGKAGLGVLITQCLQNDFVKPLAPYTPCPTSCTSATTRRAG